jgi:hypothetical protein
VLARAAHVQALRVHRRVDGHAGLPELAPRGLVDRARGRRRLARGEHEERPLDVDVGPARARVRVRRPRQHAPRAHELVHHVRERGVREREAAAARRQQKVRVVRAHGRAAPPAAHRLHQPLTAPAKRAHRRRERLAHLERLAALELAI